MTGSDLDVVEITTFSKLGSNFINVRSKVSLVLYSNNVTIPSTIIVVVDTYSFSSNPLALGEKGVGQRALLSNTDTISTIVHFTGLGNLKTTKSFLNKFVLLRDQIVITKTYPMG